MRPPRAASPPAVEAARRTTRTIPIVMVTTDDPVANGLVAVPGRPLLTLAQRSRLATFAAQNRIPAMFPLPEFVDAGGLIAYGPSWSDAFRRAAVQVDRILRGARPAELPVERPSRFELHINLKAARALELPVPSSLLAKATRVLQ